MILICWEFFFFFFRSFFKENFSLLFRTEYFHFILGKRKWQIFHWNKFKWWNGIMDVSRSCEPNVNIDIRKRRIGQGLYHYRNMKDFITLPEFLKWLRSQSHKKNERKMKKLRIMSRRERGWGRKEKLMWSLISERSTTRINRINIADSEILSLAFILPFVSLQFGTTSAAWGNRSGNGIH